MTISISVSLGRFTDLSDDELSVLLDGLECISAAIDDRRDDYVRGRDPLNTPPEPRVLDLMADVERTFETELSRVGLERQRRKSARFENGVAAR